MESLSAGEGQNIKKTPNDIAVAGEKFDFSEKQSKPSLMTARWLQKLTTPQSKRDTNCITTPS